MAFMRWNRLNHGCWRNKNFLSSWPGILVIWVGTDQGPTIAKEFYETDNVLEKARELNKYNVWYSAVYTKDLTKESRQLLMKEMILLNQDQHSS